MRAAEGARIGETLHGTELEGSVGAAVSMLDGRACVRIRGNPAV